MKNEKTEISYTYSPIFQKTIKIEHKDGYSLVYVNEKPDVRDNMTPTKFKTPESAEISYYLKESSRLNNEISKLKKSLQELNAEINIQELRENFPEYFI